MYLKSSGLEFKLCGGNSERGAVAVSRNREQMARKAKKHQS